MASYKPGDLSKMLQMSTPNAVSLPKVKKAKKKHPVVDPEQQVANTNTKPVKSKQQQLSEGDKRVAKKSTKKRKQKDSIEGAAQQNMSPSKENKQVTDDAAPPPKKKKKAESVVKKTESVAVKKKRTKKKKKKTEGNNMAIKETDEQTGQPGFSPPAGIVHESLQKKKKQKTTVKHEEKDEEETGTMDVKSTTDAKSSKKKRIHKDRLLKKVEDRTVFVGNLSLKMDKEKVKRLFKKFGEIETARIRCVPVGDLKLPKKAIAIKKQFHPERNNCVAYIQFTNSEDAQKSLSNNGLLVNGLHIQVDMAGRVKSHDTRKTIFVGNLPFDVEEEAVRSHFEDCGAVEAVRIVRDKKTCIGKGFGYVTFSDTDAVTFAMKLNNQTLKGRSLRVMHCSADNEKKKKGKPGKKEQKSGGKQTPSGAEGSFQGEIGKKEKKKDKKKDRKNVNKNKTKIIFNVKDKKADQKAKESKKLTNALEKVIADSNSEKAKAVMNSDKSETKTETNGKKKFGKGDGKKKLKGLKSMPVKDKISADEAKKDGVDTSVQKGSDKTSGNSETFKNKGKPGPNKGFSKDFKKPFGNSPKFASKGSERGQPSGAAPKFGGKSFADRPNSGPRFGDRKPNSFADRQASGPRFGDRKPNSFADRQASGPRFGDRKPYFNDRNNSGKRPFIPNKPATPVPCGKHIKFD